MDVAAGRGQEARVCGGMVLLRIIHCSAQGRLSGQMFSNVTSSQRKDWLLLVFKMVQDQGAIMVSPKFSPKENPVSQSRQQGQDTFFNNKKIQ